MNNMRILICTIFTLLVAIMVYLYVNYENAGSQTDNRTLEQLNEEYAQALLNSELNEPVAMLNTPVPLAPAPETDFVKQLTIEEEKALAEAEIKRQADELEAEAMAAEKAKIDAEIAENKAPPVTDARLNLIAQALVMATVNHYDEASRITLLDLSRPENVTNGQILGIRRKQSGIIGRVKIDRIQNGQAFADPIAESFFGGIEIRVGDELIVIP